MRCVYHVQSGNRRERASSSGDSIQQLTSSMRQMHTLALDRALGLQKVDDGSICGYDTFVMTAIAKKLDARLNRWTPETAKKAKQLVAEMIELADHDALGSLREFQRQFASEEACQQYLAACRWPDGFKCPRCGNQHAYVMTRLWQCAGCRHQVSLTSGTILHNTRVSLVLWFWAAYLMTTETWLALAQGRAGSARHFRWPQSRVRSGSQTCVRGRDR